MKTGIPQLKFKSKIKFGKIIQAEWDLYDNEVETKFSQEGIFKFRGVFSAMKQLT